MIHRPHVLVAMLAFIALPHDAPPARAAVLPEEFVEEVVTGDLDGAVNFDFLPDGRILVVERQTARIRVVVPGATEQPGPVGTVEDVRTEMVEDGLLGIAVDPRWPASPYVYVHHVSASTPNIKVVRYGLFGDLEHSASGALMLDTESRREVLSDLPNDAWLHNGGTLLFGPDHYLYVGLGDDGVPCLAQDIHQLRGKILRLDVSGIPDGPGPVWPYALLAPPGNPFFDDPDVRARLVWHRGLRNPWSFAFDPNSSAMAIADVGESSWEEVNVIDLPGRNFGWPVFEGAAIYDAGCEDPDVTDLTLPVFTYPHEEPEGGWTVIMGGFVPSVGGSSGRFPIEYAGDLFFLDFYTGWLRRLENIEGTWVPAPAVPGQKELYAWGSGFQFVPRMRFGPDGALWYVRGSDLRRIGWSGTVDAPATPGEGVRLAAFPTPASGPVTLEFTLAHEGRAEVAVFDARGRLVRRLAEARVLPAGTHRLPWDGLDAAGRAAAPGLYFGALEVAGQRHTRRIVRIRG